MNMNDLNYLYEKAVSVTKENIKENLDSFFAKKSEMPHVESFLSENLPSLKEIWRTAWKNRIQTISNEFKKSYLRKKGILDIQQKLNLRDTFIHEVMKDMTFNVEAWVREEFNSDSEEWKQRYEKAVEAHQERQKEERRRTAFRRIRKDFENFVFPTLNEKNEEIETLFLKDLSFQLVWDFKNKVRYEIPDNLDETDGELKEIGQLSWFEFDTLNDFLQEPTGEAGSRQPWERMYSDYETYQEKYERDLYEEVLEEIVSLLFNLLPENIRSTYEDMTGEMFSDKHIRDIIDYSVSEMISDKLDYFGDWKLIDMIQKSDVPPDLEESYKEYVQKKEEEQIQKEKEEQLFQQKMKDIFGTEYGQLRLPNTTYYLHLGDTNTGKTYQALEKLKQASSGLYLAPLRLLALEVYETLKASGLSCGLKTGEEERNLEGASHIACTVEMFQEREQYDVVVIDEVQMIADKERGFSWYKAITKAKAKEIHLVGSLNSKELLFNLLQGARVELVEYTRDTPLEVESQPFHIKKAKKGDAIVVFSRHRVLQTAAKLEEDGHKVSVIYGSMPPETRRKQMERFLNGETDIVVATDAIGMGLNLPIQRVVFLENEKFDGTHRRPLTSQEVKQIAGRAGRKGLYEVGYVAFCSEIKQMRKRLHEHDRPLDVFTIEPTRGVFERFLRYHHTLQDFFTLWNRFENPEGTIKSSLSQEAMLYLTIKGSDIENRLSLMDLYSYLQLPFQAYEEELKAYWLLSMKAIVRGEELPEPNIQHKGTLEQLEMSYKKVNLHLLFLYHLNKRTMAYYWERVRTEISEEINRILKTEMKSFKKTCKYCDTKLPWDYEYAMCNSCYRKRYSPRRSYWYEDFDDFDDDFDFDDDEVI